MNSLYEALSIISVGTNRVFSHRVSMAYEANLSRGVKRHQMLLREGRRQQEARERRLWGGGETDAMERLTVTGVHRIVEKVVLQRLEKRRDR